MPRLTTALLLACCLPLAAARAADSEPAEMIATAAQDYVSGRLGGGVQSVAAPLDPRLRLPACAAALETSGPAPNPGNAWSVAVHCSGPATWTIYVPVHASQRRSVVVATRTLPPGLPIPADAVALQERDVTALSYGYLMRIEDVVGRMPRHPVAAATALTPEAIAAATSIHRGQQVTLLCEAGSFSVRADGKALSDGASGERIKAENLDSRRVVEGVVRDDGVLQVDP